MAAEKTEKKTHKKTQEKTQEKPRKGAGRASRRGPEERRPEPVQLPETKIGPHPETPPQPAD